MIRLFALAVALLACSLLGAAGGEGAASENPKLHGKVGPGFTITLTDDSGVRVTRLDPGTYDVEVEDESEEHNFRLEGPGVSRATDVGGVGKELWTVTLTEGTYRYQCDPHATRMRGSFTVGSAPNPPPTTPPPVVAVKPGSRLVLTSGPGFSITLKTKAGKNVTAMERGAYTIVVRDRSRIHNAHVVAPGVNRRTRPLSYVGTQTWKVALARTGTFRFLCDPHARAGMKGTAKIVA